MGRKKLNPVNKITKLLTDAALTACDLPFGTEANKNLTDEIWTLSNKINALELEWRNRVTKRNPDYHQVFNRPPVVKVLYVTDHTVVIQCPYCNQRHIHGKKSGHSVAHCLQKNPDNLGYIIPDLDP